MNLFSETTVQTLNKNLTFGENVQGQKYTTTFTTAVDYELGDFQPIIFSYTGGGQPNCCFIGQIVRSDQVPNLFQITVSDWAMNINVSPSQVKINYVAGLLPETTYTATFIVL